MFLIVCDAFGRDECNSIRLLKKTCELAEEIGGFVSERFPANNYLGYRDETVYVTIRCQELNPI